MTGSRTWSLPTSVRAEALPKISKRLCYIIRRVEDVQNGAGRARAGGRHRHPIVASTSPFRPGLRRAMRWGREVVWRRPMKDMLARLDRRRARARLGGGEQRISRAARQGQADRARAHRPPDGSRLVRGIRHVRRAPLHRFRHGEDQDPRRRRRHRLGHGQRAHGLRVRQGFHRVRRLAERGARQEDHQDPGHGDQEPRPDHRPVRRRRRAHPGGRRGARRLWRGVPAQRAGFRRHSADLADHGPLRGRRRLFAGDDRLHLHGARHLLHVRHRPRRRQDRDQRDRHRRGTRRRAGAHHPFLDRRPRL